MRVVYKYPLMNTGHDALRMPMGAQLLHVGMQENRPMIWALVDTEQPLKLRHFFVYGTGWEINVKQDLAKFFGTAQSDNSLVWHVFDGGEGELPESENEQ